MPDDHRAALLDQLLMVFRKAQEYEWDPDAVAKPTVPSDLIRKVRAALGDDAAALEGSELSVAAVVDLAKKLAAEIDDPLLGDLRVPEERTLEIGGLQVVFDITVSGNVVMGEGRVPVPRRTLGCRVFEDGQLRRELTLAEEVPGSLEQFTDEALIDLYLAAV